MCNAGEKNPVSGSNFSNKQVQTDLPQAFLFLFFLFIVNINTLNY